MIGKDASHFNGGGGGGGGGLFFRRWGFIFKWGVPHGGVLVLMEVSKNIVGWGGHPLTMGNAVGGELPKNGGLDSSQIYGRGLARKRGFERG